MIKIQTIWRNYKQWIIFLLNIVIFAILSITFVYMKEDAASLSTIVLAMVTVVYASLTYLILDEQKNERIIKFINDEIQTYIIQPVFEQYCDNTDYFEHNEIMPLHVMSFKDKIKNAFDRYKNKDMLFDIRYVYYFKKYFPYTYDNIEKYEKELKAYKKRADELFEPAVKKFKILNNNIYQAVEKKEVTYKNIKESFPSQCEEYEKRKKELKKLNENIFSSLTKEIKTYNLLPPVVKKIVALKP